MDVHHRSLCPKKFKNTMIRESVQIVDEFQNNTCETPESENALLSSKESFNANSIRENQKSEKLSK